MIKVSRLRLSGRGPAGTGFRGVLLGTALLGLVLSVAAWGRVRAETVSGPAVSAGPGEAEVVVEPHPRFRETEYYLSREECRIGLILYQTEVNRGVLKHSSRCSLPLQEQMPLFSQVLAAVLVDARGPQSLRTLFWGRLAPGDGEGPLEMSQRLAVAAKQSREWDLRRGRPRGRKINDFVIRLANQRMIYRELKVLFAKFGLDLEVSGAEKVLVAEAGKLPFFSWLQKYGVRKKDELPYDCLLWFSIRPIKGWPVQPR